jgi:DNA-directed RNA polymerase subunit M/transcription elongation factor TFIIS
LKNPELDLSIVDSVYSLEEARKIQALLKAAAIQPYFGTDYIEDLDSFHGSFEDGVDVRVSGSAEAIAFALIQEARKNDPQLSPDDSNDYDDSDEQKTSASTPDGEYVHCPKCHSEQIEFEGESGLLAKLNWHCDECGHDWQDAGHQ